ncbi:hypothetical protein KEM54_006030 [Ascosphaera aggregata]|nr:hypothetical protein KEM54_006030 [Ascosphaera aggregata]
MARPRAAPKRPMPVADQSITQQENLRPAKRQRVARKPIEQKSEIVPKKKTATITENATGKQTLRRTRSAATAEQNEAKADLVHRKSPAKRGRPKKEGTLKKVAPTQIPAGFDFTEEEELDNEIGEEKDQCQGMDQDLLEDASEDELGSTPSGTEAERVSIDENGFASNSMRNKRSSPTMKSAASHKPSTAARKATSSRSGNDIKEADKKDEEDEISQDIGIKPDEAENRMKDPIEEADNLLERFTRLQNTPGGRRENSLASLMKGVDDPALRRKLKEITEKYEGMESRYRQLREVGIREANANVEQMKKQCENTVTSSKALVDYMTKELEASRLLARQSQSLQKQLDESNFKVAELTRSVEAMTTSLSNAQNEIMMLQTKLSAARSTAATVETMKVPNSVMKNNRGLTVAGAEATKAAKLAQLKEDLYSDLSGLIIRGVKIESSHSVYDCIQTGLNGTLHFKLGIPNDDGGSMASRDTAEIRYTPLLDESRDRRLIDILPEYLTVEINFARTNAPVFYRRVVDVLTKKIEGEEEDDDDDDEDDEDEEDDDEEQGGEE